jgi:outer membrane lipoprotein-sorting protein
MDDLFRPDRQLSQLAPAAGANRRLPLLAVVAVVLFIQTPAPAPADLTLNEVLARMEQTQQTIQDISFSYVMHARQGQFQGKTTGNVELKKPSLLVVHQQKPEKLTIVTDGTTLWLYSPKQKQVLKGDWNAWVEHSKFPLVLMNFVGAFNSGSWQERYQGTLEAHEEGQYKIRFVNRVPDAAPPVVLWVSDQTYMPQRGDLFGRGYTAQVTIKNIKTNTGLTETALSPRFPEGTVEVPVPF